MPAKREKNIRKGAKAATSVKIKKNKIVMSDERIPADESVPSMKEEPDDLPEENPFETPTYTSPDPGEGP